MSTKTVYYANAIPKLELVARVNQKVLVGIDRRLRASNYTVPQRRLLLAIGRRPGSTHAELADELAMKRSLVSKTVSELVAKEFVETEPTSRHRGQRLLTLTPAGVTAAQDLNESQKAAFVREVEALSPGENSALMAAMDNSVRIDPPAITGAMVTVRPAFSEHVIWIWSQAVRSGVNDFYWKDPFLVTAAKGLIVHLSQGVRSDDQVAWVALYEGKMVGGCVLTLAADPTEAAPGVPDVHAWISAVTVLPQYRSRGIGARLLDTAIQAAEELTAVSVSIRAAKRQEGLTNLARTQGFKPRANTIEDRRTGTQELWRDYTLKLPRRASKVRERQKLAWSQTPIA